MSTPRRPRISGALLAWEHRSIPCGTRRVQLGGSDGVPVPKQGPGVGACRDGACTTPRSWRARRRSDEPTFNTPEHRVISLGDDLFSGLVSGTQARIVEERTLTNCADGA